MTPTVRPHESSARPRRVRRRLLTRLALAALVAAGVPPAAARESGGDLFDTYELVTGEASERQTVLTGFFLGGATAEVAVVRVDDSDGRRVQMFGFDGGAWESVLEATLRPEVLFVDVARVDGRDRLITYEPGRLSWLDPDSATERPLVDLPASYRAAHAGEIPQVDVTRDLNRDGRDDLIVPDVDGFWISTQAGDGSFAEAVKLGPPEPFAETPIGNLDVEEPVSDPRRTYGEVGITAPTVPVYLDRVHQMDYDRDGRSDLVFWNQDHFEVYLQDERGRFDPAPETFTTDVPFDSDGVYTRAFEYRDRGALSTIFGLGEKTERTVLYAIRDLDGDRVADLVTLRLAGRSIARQRSVYQVHFGRPTDGGTAFAREVGAVIQPRGKAGGMQPWGYASRWLEDFDGDGQVDVLFRDLAIGLGGIGGMMRALVGNSVPLDLELYRGEDGVYPDQPATRRKIRRFAPFAGLGNVFFPAVLVGDVNGDGRCDLVVGQSPRELHVFPGVPGPDLLARHPQKVAVALPYDERNTRLVDLNRDGKRDLLIHRAPTGHAPNEPHRVAMLIAR